MATPLHPSHLPMKAASDLDRCTLLLRQAGDALQAAQVAMLFAYGFQFGGEETAQTFDKIAEQLAAMRAVIFEAEGILQ